MRQDVEDAQCLEATREDDSLMHVDARKIFIEAELSRHGGKISRLEKKYGLPKEIIGIWMSNDVEKENPKPPNNTIMDRRLTGGRTFTVGKVYSGLDKLNKAWDKASHESFRKAFVALEVADNKTEEALAMKYGVGMPIIEKWANHKARVMLDVLVSHMACTRDSQAKREVGEAVDKIRSGLDRLDAEWSRSHA